MRLQMSDVRNVDEFRSKIDSGQTGDKMPWSDPAAAPLGTDDEAAGTPPTRAHAPVFGTSRAAGKALQRLFDNQIVDQAALALRREWPQLRSWPRSFLCVVAASWLTFVMAWLELYSLTAIRGLYSGSSQRTGLSGG